ncbi:MAG: hypothetical protein AAF585_01030 [Verrucomicrobiota bacterium]
MTGSNVAEFARIQTNVVRRLGNLAISATFLVFTASIAAAPSASIKVRDTSFFVGTPFNFYVHIEGVKSAPQPQLLDADALTVRYAGAAPSSRSSEVAFTFTYEAVPIKPGRIQIPGGTVHLDGEDYDIKPASIEVGAPAKTDQMELNIELSHDQCYVGEAVVMTFTWTTNLSLNGVRAVDIRIPALAERSFRVREPMPTESNDDNRIGLPVSHQRTIANYSKVERNGESAMQLKFQRILVPNQAGSIDIEPAMLLCSYSKPREAEFKGTRYPEYFDNDFFDQDVVGDYERFLVQSEPTALQIQQLPREGQPADFSGLVGAFELYARAEPAVVEARQPITLWLEADNVDFPHLLDLPALETQPAVAHNFQLPSERSRTDLKPASATYTQTIHPLRETVSAIPAIEYSYFDPKTKSYGVARTSPIPITVTRAPVMAATEAEFADGSKLRNEVRPEFGGIFHNRTGPQLLIPQQPGSWMSSKLVWTILLILPPAIFAFIWYRSREYRDSLDDPDAVRRRIAFRKLRRALKPDLSPKEISAAVRAYIAERFNIAGDVHGESQLRQLLKKHAVDEDEAQELIALVASVDAAAFAENEYKPGRFDKTRVLEVMRKVEHAAIWVILLVVAGSSIGAEPSELLASAEEFLAKANEAALVDPAVSGDLYQRAADQFEQLIHEEGIENGELFYNLGNVYYLKGDVGRALLNYRRAELYLPMDSQLRDALKYVRTQRADFFPDASWDVRSGRLRVIANMIFFYHHALSQPSRVIATLILYITFWGLAAAALFLRGHWRIRTLVGLGVILIVVGGSTYLHAARNPQKEAVVVEREVLPRKGDAFIYDAAFNNPIHSGAELRILEERREWWKVRFEDGNEGWIPADTAERVALN